MFVWMINFNPFLLKFSVGLISSGQEDMSLAVVVAQLVEGSLPTPEVRGSNPVIGKLLNIEHCILSTVLKRWK